MLESLKEKYQKDLEDYYMKQDENTSKLNELKRKSEKIKNHESAKKRRKFYIKLFTIIISGSIVISSGMLISASSMTIKNVLLAFLAGGFCTVGFGIGPWGEFKEEQREFKELSKEEYEKLKLEEEKDLELEKTLIEENSKLNGKIISHRKVLHRIKQKENTSISVSNSTLYKDTKEEPIYLATQKRIYEQSLDQYLNERINYTDINLEVNHQEAISTEIVEKKLTKTYSKNKNL